MFTYQIIRMDKMEDLHEIIEDFVNGNFGDAVITMGRLGITAMELGEIR